MIIGKLNNMCELDDPVDKFYSCLSQLTEHILMISQFGMAKKDDYNRSCYDHLRRSEIGVISDWLLL